MAEGKIFVKVIKNYMFTNKSHELLNDEDEVMDLLCESPVIERMICEDWVEEHPEYVDSEFEDCLTPEGEEAQIDALEQLYADTLENIVENGLFDGGNYWIYCVDEGTDWQYLRR